MIDNLVYQTFKRGSKTFFTSSLFFPRKVRDDVFAFYGFVRVADDLVDTIPSQTDAYFDFKNKYKRALVGEKIDNVIIDSFVELVRRKNIPLSWVESFFAAMEMDVNGRKYSYLEDTKEYIYGSAGVIGLIMARILDLPKASFEAAKMLGFAFQYINFIRDVAEDMALKRSYFPEEFLQKYGLKEMSYEAASAQPEAFRQFMRDQVALYFSWKKSGEDGFKFIPKRYRTAIMTAGDMYDYTARQIVKDPFVVFKHKVKPGYPRILGRVIINFISCLFL